MKTDLKRKNYYLDEKKIRRVRAILGTKTETEAIDCFEPGSFQKRDFKITGKSRWQRRCGEGFLVAKHLIDTSRQSGKSCRRRIDARRRMA
jgi:ribosomal protein S27AE